MALLSTPRSILPVSALPKGLTGFRNRLAPELLPSGVTELDGVLEGGFPRGSLVEVCGPASSGRSSLGLALLTQATRHGEACAFIDVSDSLDPVSSAAAGVDLSRLLWIRCGEEAADRSAEPQRPSNIGQTEKKKNDSRTSEKEKSNQMQTHFFWKHPRNQIHGIEASIPQLMRKKQTQDKARISADPRWSEEQEEPDRQLPRRGENIRKHLPPARPHFQPQQQNVFRSGTRKPWKRLEQALKATDLLLHSGGWGVVVFDLGSISWVDARRIPLSTWFRFQRTIENTPTILLLLGEDSCAKSCASVVLRCRRSRENWDSAICTKTGQGPATLQGFEVQGEIVRSRRQSQAFSCASWETHTVLER